MTTILHYEQNAAELVSQYELPAFEEVNTSLLDLLPAPGSTILDIGAGSRRDAALFAARGDDVVTVEPSDAMRTHARALHPTPRINWLSDSLPELAQVRRLGLTFDFILLSAAWMHVPPASRARAMHVVSLSELTAPSQQFGLRLLHANDSEDRLGRTGVARATAVLGLPDDGLGALPLLRHLVLVDEKSSTYKIALLRMLARIADTANGSARHEADDVAIPLRLVALFWLRMYKPLIENALAQMPETRTGSRPGFVTDNFTSLRAINPFELRVGAVFNGETANRLHRSLGEIAQIIRTMPAKYLRWPASDQPIFEIVPKRRIATPSPLVIDAPFLWSFGELRVPLQIWQALGRYNVWIEPVLIA